MENLTPIQAAMKRLLDFTRDSKALDAAARDRLFSEWKDVVIDDFAKIVPEINDPTILGVIDRSIAAARELLDEAQGK